MPCGLCAASSRIVGDGTDPLQPSRRVGGGEPFAHDLGVELAGGRPGAEERLHRGQRDRGVLRLVRAVQRQEDLVVHAAQALQREHLATDGELPADNAELAALAGDRRADVDAALEDRAVRPPASWAATITVAPLWMMPDLAVAMSASVSPSHSVWSSPIGVMTQVPA